MVKSDMQTRCQDCNASFLLTPSGATQSVACPQCGGTRLERDQPSPIKDDGEMSAKNPGMGINQRGIPEREGIFGGDSDTGVDTGWQPLRRRDESFANVKIASAPQHKFQVDNGMIHNGNIDALKWFDAHINDVPARDDSRFGEILGRHSPHKGNPCVVAVHHPEHEQSVREIIENGSGMTGPETLSKFAPTAMETMRAIGRGEVPPPIGADVNRVSKTANDFDFDMSMFEPDSSGRTPIHKFIIDRSGKVYSKPEPTHHEEIALHHGLLDPDNPGDFPKGLSQGLLHDNGETEWYTHDTPHSAEALASMLHGHFGHPVAIDPNLKPTTSEERFLLNTPETRDVRDIRLQSPERENDMLEALKQRAGRPFGYYENPFINRGGSVERTLNMEPYLPWTHEAQVHESWAPLLALAPLAEAIGIGGGAAAAEGAAGATGGSGLMGGLMGRALQGTAMGHAMNTVKNNAPGGGGGAAPQQIPVDPSRLTHTADLQTPVSNPAYHEAPDGDTKQFGLGDHDPAAQNPNLPGEAGGSAKGEDAVREHAGFAPNSPGIERAQMLLPLLLRYYHSDESGANDPLIKSLHEQLETESPGYLDHADQTAVDKWLNTHSEHGVHARTAAPWGWGAVPDTYDTRPEGPAFAQDAQQQNQQPGVCPYCQGRQSQDGSCPKCGAKGPDQSKVPVQPDLNGGAQGLALTNPPQSVPPPGYHAKIATEPGHCEHCGAVVDAKGNCPQCGASVPSIENPGTQAPDIGGKTASDHQGPSTPEQISAVQQYLIDNGRIEEVPDVPLKPELYANELSAVNKSEEPPPTIDPSQTPPPQPTQEIAPPGATMPVPNPAAPQMQQPLSRVAGEPEPSAIDVGQPDPNQVDPNAQPDRDNSQTWQTDNGEPLQEGQTYEMHSDKYEIPDVVKVVAVKPNAIIVETIDEYSDDPNQRPLNYQHEITKDEAQLEGLTFIPQDGQHEDANGPENGQPDTSEAPVNTEPTPASHQHETRASVEADEEKCPKCSSEHVTSSMSSSTTSFHECYRCGNSWETKEDDYSTDGSKVAAWVLEDGPKGDDFFAEMERVKAMREAGATSRNLSDIAAKDPRYNAIQETLNEASMQREAGKKFTPKEQREYIDERGVARNADKLDLAGTHYESHRYLDKANGDNVDDAELFLGI